MSDTDMYLSVPYDTYSGNARFKDSMTAQHPVKGTIARGQVPYEYPNTEAGYLAAKDSLRSPLWTKQPGDSVYRISKADMDNGKKMYDIYCISCHGATGDGQGELVKREKFLGIPSYETRDITEGSIYHVIMHGRNLMGSHASQLTHRERWQVVHYVEELRNKLKK
ncbi:cytochrome c [Flavobacteriaceae bacterium F08102]|nr:cytochrome c [Flavobacteriaceae bacterium F08102]